MSPIEYQGELAHQRLNELGLSMEDLVSALQVGAEEARRYGKEFPLDPKMVSGLLRWGRTNGALRQRLHQRGWGVASPRNLPLAISPDRTCAISATTGNESTGIRGEIPETRYTKGVATREEIRGNHGIQMVLEFPGFEMSTAKTRAREQEPRKTWLLLYHDTDTKIHAELSLPDPLDLESAPNAEILRAWRERILVPTFALE